MTIIRPMTFLVMSRTICSALSCGAICSNASKKRVVCTPTGQVLLMREKSKSSKKRTNVEESDEESDWEEIMLDSAYSDVGRDYKDLIIHVSSLRLDTILKSGLGLTNSKVESSFYDSRIRLNGNKVLKKSTMVNLGDEADIIIGLNAKNKEFLDVMRIVPYAKKFQSEKNRIHVKVRRFKHLTITNYETSKWSESPTTDE